MTELDWARLQELGLYDPAAANASERRELLAFFAERGITETQMVAALAGNRLLSLVSDLTIRPGRDRFTRDQAAVEAGIEPNRIDRIWRAAGLPTVASDLPFYSESDVETLQAFALGADLFGEDAVLRFTRVIGTSLSRIAEAALAMAVAERQGPMEQAGADEAAFARSNEESTAALNAVPMVLEVLFRHHMEASIRRFDVSRPAGALRTVNLAVAFLDLVGFTERSRGLSTHDLAAAVADFEKLVGEEIAARDARLVKMIGDEVMYVATDAVTACRIALELGEAIAAHPVLTGLRGGVVFGEVVSQDGDYYGREVNVAARIVAEAEPGEVLATAAVAAALGPGSGIEAHTRGDHDLRGFDRPVEVFALSRRGSVDG